MHSSSCGTRKSISDIWARRVGRCPRPLIDAHALLSRRIGSCRLGRRERARFRAGAHRHHVSRGIGAGDVRLLVADVLPSPADVTLGNDVMLDICATEPDRTRMLVTVNPNYTDHALAEIERCVARGAIGVKLLASRRADDPLLDPVAEIAAERGLPILHHVWQHRRREWPSQEISDGADLARLAARHPRANFILAHIGGGGDYMHTFPAVADCPEYLSRSLRQRRRSGACSTKRSARSARGDCCGAATSRCAPDWPNSTRSRLSASTADIAAIRWENAASIFPPNSFPRCTAAS